MFRQFSKIVLILSSLFVFSCIHKTPERPIPINPELPAAPDFGDLTFSERTTEASSDVVSEPTIPDRKEWFRFQRNELLETHQRFVTDLSKAMATKPDFANTIVPVDRMYETIYRQRNLMEFYLNVHPDPLFRETSRKYYEVVDRYLIAIGHNRLLYRLVEMISAGLNKGNQAVEERTLVDTLIENYAVTGLDKPDDVRKKIAEIKEDISTLATIFSMNIAEYENPTEVVREELVGMDEAFIGRLQRNEDRYIIPLYETNVAELLKFAKNADLRKTVYIKSKNIAAVKNIPILRELLAKRRELANLLGFPSHVHTKTINRMVVNPERVEAFLDTIRKHAQPMLTKDYNDLLSQKAMIEDDPDAVLYPWDISFYAARYREQRFSIDEQNLNAYFPLDKVIDQGLFATFGPLFGISFEPEQSRQYHPSVRTYAIYQENRRIGSFLFDLFPRSDKYNHAAEFDLVSHTHRPGEPEQDPLAALVCNFPLPTPTVPSLLSIGDVEILFHEFGHLLHAILSRTSYALTAGTSTKLDFVEAPSQTMERFARSSEVVKRFARHYQSDEPLSQRYLDYIDNRTRLLSGLNTMIQVFYATFDLSLHKSIKPIDPNELWQSIAREMIPTMTSPDTFPEAGFGHLADYDAGYYSYLWSDVLAADFFNVFKTNEYLSPKTGKEFRDQILSRGGSDKPDNLVRQFLKRESTPDVFFEELGFGDED